jgi:uncharacterized protein (DUF2062 family)
MADAPLVSRCGRWWSNLWTWIACGAWPGDSQSGLRIYPLPLTKALRVKAGRFAFEVEVLVRAVWAGLAVHPVPVAVLYPADRVSHFHKWYDNWRTVWTFTRLVTRRCQPWPQRKLVKRPRPRLRDLLLGGLEPWPAAQACALGSAIGVAPLPGLQFVLAAFLSWWLRLNIPLVMFMSNLSFGPLLFVWGALQSALGNWMRTGASPLDTYHWLFAEFSARVGSVAGFSDRFLILLELMRTFLLDWLLGSLVVVPLVAVLAGGLGYAIAALAARRRW